MGYTRIFTISEDDIRAAELSEPAWKRLSPVKISMWSSSSLPPSALNAKDVVQRTRANRKPALIARRVGE